MNQYSDEYLYKNLTRTIRKEAPIVEEYECMELVRLVEKNNMLDIVIPIHNESIADIDMLLPDVFDVLAKSRHWEIRDYANVIIVDDGTDWSEFDMEREYFPTYCLESIMDHIEEMGYEETLMIFTYEDLKKRVRFISSNNNGAATARNIGAVVSNADYIAFLDADDRYEEGALDTPLELLRDNPDVGLVRLNIEPVGFPKELIPHGLDPEKDRDKAFVLNKLWQSLSMTLVSNGIWNRKLYLACGGCSNDDLFKKFGGEDATISIASTYLTKVITLFDNDKHIPKSKRFAGIKHTYHENSHAAKMIRNYFEHHSGQSKDNDNNVSNEIDKENLIKLRLANEKSLKILTDIVRLKHSLLNGLEKGADKTIEKTSDDVIMTNYHFDLNSDNFKQNIINLKLE